MYRKYTTELFVADDNFRRWVLKPTRADDQFWSNYQREHPQQIETVKDARAIIQATERYFKEERVSAEEMAASYEIVQARIRGEVTSRRSPLRFTGRLLMRVAAALGLLFILGGLWMYTSAGAENLNVYATEIGEEKELFLPDGSRIQLGANSELRFARDWRSEESRVVWLTGEAYFTVRPLPKTGQKFIVHTGALDVTVLGTSFNVNTHAVQTEVALEEGEISLTFTHNDTLTSVTMEPGEIVQYDTERAVYNKARGDMELYTAWKDGELYFENASLLTITTRLEQFYPLSFVVTERASSVDSIRVRLPTEDLAQCLEILGLLLANDGFTISEDGRRIYIE